MICTILAGTRAFISQPRTTLARRATPGGARTSLALADFSLLSNNNESALTTIVQSSTFITAATSDLSLRNSDVVVFIAGIIPFIWATIEFWRRIAVGEPFGTGKDSVVIVRPSTTTTTIGQDGNPSQSRGRQTLGQGALIVAYILFGVAAGVIVLALYSVLSSSNSMEPSLPLSLQEQAQSLL